MTRKNWKDTLVTFPVLAWVFCSLLPGLSSAADSVCAEVQIQVQQEVTLERQAFDAHMRINNGLDHISLENVAVSIHFTDQAGTPVLASSNPEGTEALFFIRLDTIQNISAVDGTGIVNPGASADIHWLIIPAPGAANGMTSGTLYFVGATLTYIMGGEEQITKVTPDYIYIKPMPILTLDYFLPSEIYGDDAFTPEIESAEPFSLGVRVTNTGAGPAHNLKIESAQPKIVENEHGLLINFVIKGSQVNGTEVSPSLLVDFGDIAAENVGIARWIMATTLSGRFTSFTANFSHADALGGAMTSLIEEVNTHALVRDVLVDLNGRDTIRDFLSTDGTLYKIYESNGEDAPVTYLSTSATLQPAGDSFTLSTLATEGFSYLQLPDPYSGGLELAKIVRSDGKVIKPENRWLSKTRDGESWTHHLNLFDMDSTGEYTVIFSESLIDAPPSLTFIPDQILMEGVLSSFTVSASDDNDTPTLNASPLPALASFIDQKTGAGLFGWTPAVGQAGSYEITFTASDGVQGSEQKATFNVYSNMDSDNDGLPDGLEAAICTYPDNDDTDNDGLLDGEEDSNHNGWVDPYETDPCNPDTDGDGTDDGDEVEAGNDPLDPEDAPNTPPIASSGPDRNTMVGEKFILDGSASHDPENMFLTFEWNLVSIPEGSTVTGPHISGWATPRPSFQPDIPGEYVFELTVSDSMLTATDTMTVKASASNVEPNADAGTDQYAIINNPVYMDGTKSADPDKSPTELTLTWDFATLPTASDLSVGDIINDDSADGWFTPDVEGIYILRLAVSDGDLTDEDLVQIMVSSSEVKPNAHAGEDRKIEFGRTVTLNGQASKDPDNRPDPIAFSWTFVYTPSGSNLGNNHITDNSTALPFFTPDTPGVYVVKLVISDGLEKDSDTVAITVFSPISGDLDHDGDVDEMDYDLFNTTLAKCDTDPTFNPEADYDSDTCITDNDFQIWQEYRQLFELKSDMDTDGDVDSFDLAYFTYAYTNKLSTADLNRDNLVNEADVAYFAKQMGK